GRLHGIRTRRYDASDVHRRQPGGRLRGPASLLSRARRRCEFDELRTRGIGLRAPPSPWRWRRRGPRAGQCSLGGAEWFVAFSICMLAVLKLRNLETFANMFLGYDLLAQRYVRYAYVYA